MMPVSNTWWQTETEGFIIFMEDVEFFKVIHNTYQIEAS
jgi:acyl-coenzyme A synthetase/AMP-(fatty) acid ligase